MPFLYFTSCNDDSPAVQVLDPETLAAQFLKPEDQAIKEKDFPERLQLAGIDPSEVRVLIIGLRRVY
jgi:hypothetical protein